MNTTSVVMNKIFQYEELQQKFIALCAELIEVLPTPNAFRIQVGSGTNLSRDLTILYHPCKMDFCVQERSGQLRGKITFKRSLPQDKAICFLTVYFDSLGNATETANAESYSNALSGTHITNWLAGLVVEKFLDSLTADSESITE